MTKKERLLCRIGLHKWTRWHAVNIPLEPIGGRGIFSTEQFSLETRTRHCNRCQRGQVKKVLHW